MKPTACKMAISGRHTPTAAVALGLPMRPTKYVSAILYSAVMSMLMMVGTERDTTSLGMGVSSICCSLPSAV